MGTTHLTALQIAETLAVTGASTLTGNVAIGGTLATTGAYTPTGGITLGTDKKVQFRDTAIYINSTSDGVLNLVSDTEIDISTTTVDLNGALDVSGTTALGDTATLATNKKIQFRDTGLYIYSESDGALTVSSDGTYQVEAVTSASMVAPVAGVAVDETADGSIGDKRLCIIDGSGDLVEADTDSVNVAGINAEGAAVTATDPMILGTRGHFTGVADALIEGGTHLKSCSGGRVGRFITTTLAGTTMKTQATAGAAFANQPANDGVTIVSDSAADTSLAVTIIGTTNGTDTVVVEAMTTDASDGTTPVNSTKTDWGVILAIKTDAHAGTLTVKETSGGATIKALATGTNDSGVITIAGSARRAFNKAPTVVSDAGTTKQVGLKGTNAAYAELYDSQALNGATAQTMNSTFGAVTEIYVGDLEAARTITLAVGAADDYQLLVGRAGPAGAASKDSDVIVIM